MLKTQIKYYNKDILLLLFFLLGGGGGGVRQFLYPHYFSSGPSIISNLRKTSRVIRI